MRPHTVQATIRPTTCGWVSTRGTQRWDLPSGAGLRGIREVRGVTGVRALVMGRTLTRLVARKFAPV